MSVQVSPVIEEDRLERALLNTGKLELQPLNEDHDTGAQWHHQNKMPDSPIPSRPSSVVIESETRVPSAVKPAGPAKAPLPPVTMTSRPRPSTENVPRASPHIDQAVAQWSISTDRESRDSPARSIPVLFRMTNSPRGSSESPDSRVRQREPSFNSDISAEARKIRPGSGAEMEWDKIQKLRSDNWSLRSQMREMRNHLRHLQERKSRADDLLFRRMTMQGLGLDLGIHILPGQKALGELMQDCQLARDMYGPLEDDCNNLEDRLSKQELELDRLEEAFYKRPPDEGSVVSERPLSPTGAADFEQYPSSTDEENEETGYQTVYHPLVVRYLSKMGDLDLLRERLDDLLDEKRMLEEEQKKRLRFGLVLNDEDQHWLEHSHSQEDDMLAQISILEKDLVVMKQDCLAKGLVDEDGEPIDFQAQEQRSFDNEEDMNAQEQHSEYVKYPLLLPHPGVRARTSHAHTHEPEITNPSDQSIPTIATIATIANIAKTGTYNTTSRINDWLLYRLRDSALDVNLLARTFQTFHGVIDAPHQWQVSVIRLWFRDSTMRNADGGVTIYTDSMTTQAPAITSSSTPQVNPAKKRLRKALPIHEKRSQYTSFSLDNPVSLARHLTRSDIEDDDLEIIDEPRAPRRR